MNVEGKNLKVGNYNIVLQCGQYGNGRAAIRAICGNGEPFGNLTVNLPDEHLEDGEMCIKTWSENEKFAKAAIDSGLFVDTGKRIQTGFVDAEVWKLSHTDEN